MLPGVSVPVAVFLLLLYPDKISLGGWTHHLPLFHACVNGVTTLLLLAALIAVKRGARTLHKRIMMGCVVLGGLFLLSYVLFHLSAEPTRYGDINHDGVLSSTELHKVGTMRYVYLFVLISHIVSAFPVVFLVLRALFHAYHVAFDKHKKAVQYAFPVWLYTSVTGVVVYLMIAPYYART